ncbi:MAG: DNA mismatch repair protein MutS, partial [Planctomycetota bacterium JB042]
VTALGARLLRAWLLAPLKDVAAIRARQAAVGELVEDRARAAEIGERLSAVADVERLLTRVVTNRANARDLVALRRSLEVVPSLRAALDDANALRLRGVLDRLDPLDGLTDLLSRALVDEPPATLAEGGVIRDGHSADLDELRAIHRDGKSFLTRYQTEEIERTGIANLKVGFNRVFGFYLEVTNSFRDKVPPEYVRKQTLKNAERYITPRLKEYETKVLNAEERALALEAELFQAVREAVVAELDGLKRTAGALGELDVLFALADGAALHGHVRPEVDDGTNLEIVEGRHPVLSATMGASTFVPNDCRLDGERRRLAIVTGPNMAGKSTYIRQVALLQILAQVGAFVPAKRATLGVCDRVFARVGASDDLARGHSTFMVEMTETANILNNATDRSLVVLDEIGRGTSTFDGLAIARAISEHLLEKVRCRGLFATHYHQLIELTESFPAACNLNVAVREWGEEIVFLHQIVEGGSDRSYGIHVARLAGVPKPVLERAQAILKDLEANHPDLRPAASESANGRPAPARSQGSLFDQLEKRMAEDLKRVDLDRITPIDALTKLREWKERLS